MATLTATVTRRRLVVRGVVQGVGFRPHVARLAHEEGLAGHCGNDDTAVFIEVEGPAEATARFATRLVADAPPLARIDGVETTDLAPRGETGFAIAASAHTAGARTIVPPDTAPCAACLAELADPADRRHRHPFITCTHCGPRLSITLDLPYDRHTTTMADFAMCAACAAEYADPTDRRFHAQPIGCHDCGPRLRLLDPSGRLRTTHTEQVLAHTAHALAEGRIVAIKGLGGYHLACRADDEAAVRRLRERKQRPDQPFAVMAADLDQARTLVELDDDAAALLTGAERPILLLPRRTDAPVTPLIAPVDGTGEPAWGLDELGVLLPYTPLHHLLLQEVPGPVVMTSGNVSGEPLCITEAEALARLGDIADLFCSHDRPIAVPVEDSVMAWLPQTRQAIPVRRSRGQAPLPVDLDLDLDLVDGGVVMTAGAEVKNTVALVRESRAYVSAHIGDLESLPSRQHHDRVARQLMDFHRVRPDLVVADAHPGYASRAWAQSFAQSEGVPLLEVQHHHAHLASLAAEHGRLGSPLLGLVFDGTGYGCDATIWGGELLLLGDEGRTCERLGHLGTVRLPGGDMGVRNPVRTATLAALDSGLDLADIPTSGALTPGEAEFLQTAASRGLGVVATSSVGRLFDVVAALLGLRHRITYEAQAAIELEATARSWRLAHPDQRVAPLDLPVVDGVIEPAPLVRSLIRRLDEGVAPGELAWAFHETLATSAAELAVGVALRHGLDTIGLSGGVFVNRLLVRRSVEIVRAHGLIALTHRLVPATDGGLALGQAAVGAATLAQRRRTPQHPHAHLPADLGRPTNPATQS